MPLCQPLEAVKDPSGDYHLVQRDPHDPLAKHHVELIATVHARRGFIPGTPAIAHLLAAAPALYEAAIAAEHLLVDDAQVGGSPSRVVKVLNMLMSAIDQAGVYPDAHRSAQPGGNA